MTTTESSAQINDLLRPMGITRNMSAYSTLQQCLELICEQEDRLQAVEKDIYTPIADRKQCDPPRWHGPRTLPMCSSWRATR